MPLNEVLGGVVLEDVGGEAYFDAEVMAGEYVLFCYIDGPDRRPHWEHGMCQRVVSRTLESVGPNATLVKDGLAGAIRELKTERHGKIEVASTNLAHTLTEFDLIDEHRTYLHPAVLGHCAPKFA